MRIAPTKIETFRDDFSYANSEFAIQRFPFPFPEDQYSYSVNIEPHTLPGKPGSINEHLFDLPLRSGAGRKPAALPCHAAYGSGLLGSD